MYLSAGVITVLTAPIVWWRLDSDIATARFWSDDYERDQAVERLRANQTGMGSRVFKWVQVREMFMDPKSWLFASLICIPNIGAHVANTFGPTLIKGFGFNKYDSTLLNIPFGALQAVAIIMGSYAAYRFKIKSAMLIILTLLGLAGAVMLYVANSREVLNRPLALTGYYFLAFMFGTSPVVYSWAIANVGGNTKKSTMVCWLYLRSSND
jgi:predicted MFS family arabinose efflux permease